MQASANATKHGKFQLIFLFQLLRKRAKFVVMLNDVLDDYMLNVEIMLSYTNQFQISFDIFGQIRSTRSNPGHFHLILYKLLCEIFPLFLSFCLAHSLLL